MSDVHAVPFVQPVCAAVYGDDLVCGGGFSAGSELCSTQEVRAALLPQSGSFSRAAQTEQT